MALLQKSSAKIGREGETAAKKYLLGLGYEILCLNYCNYSGRRIGEIDIIAKENNELVFVEVKSRTFKNDLQPLAEAGITKSKLHKLSKIASFYISKNNLWDKDYRFDAISVYFSDNKKPDLKHLKNIFL